MATQAVIKLLTSISLFLFIVYHHGALCHPIDTNLSYIPLFQMEDDYSRLIENLLSRSVVREKVPPKLHAYRPLHLSRDGEEEPVQDDDDFTVDLSMYPIDVINLDTSRQVLVMSVYVEIGWKDEDLGWNVTDYAGVEGVELHSTDIWNPTLSVLNAVDHHTLTPEAGIPLALSKNGYVHHYFKFVLKTGCELDFSFFPFDIQTCMVDIYTTKETGGHLQPGDYKQKPFENFTGHGEWYLINVKMEKMKGGLLYLTKFPSVRLSVKIRRKPMFYLATMVATMAGFCFMNCLVFLIPSESGEKINFLIPIFFSNAVFTGYINMNVPRGILSQIPLILDFLLFMWMWSVVAFICSIYVLKKFRSQHKSQQLRFGLERKAAREHLTGRNRVSPFEELSSSDSSAPLRVRTFKWIMKNVHPPNLNHTKLDLLFFILGCIIVSTAEGTILYLFLTSELEAQSF